MALLTKNTMLRNKNTEYQEMFSFENASKSESPLWCFVGPIVVSYTAWCCRRRF